MLSVLLGSLLMVSIVGLTTTTTNAPRAFAQAFDITTEQGEESAVITIKLATNNTIVIPPNGTLIEVPGNVTQIDNDTVVIAPGNETITELPGNVTVITPPEPEPCGCPEAPPATAANETQGPLQPVVVTPAPGQEVITQNGTELIANESQEEPIPVPEPIGNETAAITPPAEPEVPIETNQSVTVTPEENATVTVEPEPANNDTGLSPAASFAKMLPWWEA
jgi:preprotein translocase subunit YajC